MYGRVMAAVAVVAILASACGGGAGSDKGSQADTAQESEESSPDEVAGGLTPKGGFQEGIRDDCTHLTGGIAGDIIALDNMFAPECAVVATDQVLRVTNMGVRTHTLTISEQTFKETPFLIDVNVEGGKTTETEVPLADVLDPGIYTYFCSFHAGMDGELQVFEAVG
jgi:plastocyanin